MPIRLVILDFDGTCTDAQEEALPFLESFRSELFDLFGRDTGELWEREERAVRQRPSHYGWRHGGIVAAPAGADPYLRASCIAQNLCDALGVLRDPELRSEVLQLLYRRAYAKSGIAPRPDARRVLEALLDAEYAVFVVTNSRADVVQKKLDAVGLGDATALRLVGDARKFVIDASPRDAAFDDLVDLALPGLDGRRVAIKRGHYYDVLARCWRETGTVAEQTMVCGDIFELDLALPLAVGCHVHLVYGPDTPAYEIAFVDAHPRGGASSELSGLLARLSRLQCDER